LTPLLDVRQLSNGGEIVGRSFDDVLEFGCGFVEASQFEQRAPERYPRGQIGGMLLQTRPGDLDRLVVLAGTAMLFGELRKCNRRRILEDPASKFSNPRIISHASHYGAAALTATSIDVVAV
jgi:hypothetical protein